MKIDEIDGKDGHVYRLKQIYEIQKILIAERDKRNAQYYLIEIRQLLRLDLNFKTLFKTVFKTVFKTMFKMVFKIVFKIVFKTVFKIVFKTVFEKK